MNNKQDLLYQRIKNDFEFGLEDMAQVEDLILNTDTIKITISALKRYFIYKETTKNPISIEYIMVAVFIGEIITVATDTHNQYIFDLEDFDFHELY